MPMFPSPLGDGKPRTVKVLVDVVINASVLKVFMLPADLFDFGFSVSQHLKIIFIYINLPQENGSLKPQGWV